MRICPSKSDIRDKSSLMGTEQYLSYSTAQTRKTREIYLESGQIMRFKSDRKIWISISATGEGMISYESDKAAHSFTIWWRLDFLPQFETSHLKAGDLVFIEMKSDESSPSTVILDVADQTVYFRDQYGKYRTCRAIVENWVERGFSRRFNWDGSNSIELVNQDLTDFSGRTDILRELCEINMWHERDEIIKAYLIASNLHRLV